MTKIYTDKDKISQYLKYKGISKNKFYIQTGLSTGFLDSGNSLGVDKLRKIIDNYPDFNPAWLLTGRGEMIKNVGSKQEIPEKSKRGIPLIPIDAIAGFGEGSMTVMDYDTELYNVPEFNELHVDFMIRVKGISMYPKYSSGDVVACKKLPMDTFFQWNQVYVLDTIQGAMIKRVHESQQVNHILCVSENKEYKAFEIALDEVYSLAIVVGVIRLE
jgi:phage repressor protein C with HTH and peptisase S24 domain